MERRDFLKLALAGAALPFVPRGALALDYPTRPVHMLVGQAAGSSSDLSARLIAQYLSEHLGQQFVVDIRPGATGNVATEAVVQSAPDGYTMLLVNSQNTINQAMFPDLPFDFMHDIAPIAITHRVALVMEVLPSISGANRSGIHRLCQGQSRQDQYGVGRHRRPATCRRRTVQIHGRRQSRSRALSRLDAGDRRSARRPGAGDVRRHAVVAAAYPGRQAQAACRHDAGARRLSAGRAGNGGISAGLRGVRLDRLRCAEGHAAGRSSRPQQGHQRCGGRSGHQGAV